VTFAVPLRTISIITFHPFGDNLSKGEMKFPAALLITISGSPATETKLSKANLTDSGSLTSAV